MSYNASRHRKAVTEKLLQPFFILLNVELGVNKVSKLDALCGNG